MRRLGVVESMCAVLDDFVGTVEGEDEKMRRRAKSDERRVCGVL